MLSAAAAADSASDRSTGTPRWRCIPPGSDAARPMQFSSSRARSARRAPSPAKRRATTCPSCPVAPVMTTTRFFIAVTSAQLAREHVHEQPVVERPVLPALVLPHDTHGLEPDLLVGADRPHVVGGRIDRQPVVPADLEQVSRDGSNGVR